MSEQVRSFEDLQVFQRAYAVSLAVHRVSVTLPRVEQFGLADQMRRASKSICALVMAIGSCDEIQAWSKYATDLRYIGQEQAARWKREYVELAKMLRGLSQSWV